MATGNVTVKQVLAKVTAMGLTTRSGKSVTPQTYVSASRPTFVCSGFRLDLIRVWAQAPQSLLAADRTFWLPSCWSFHLVPMHAHIQWIPIKTAAKSKSVGPVSGTAVGAGPGTASPVACDPCLTTHIRKYPRPKRTSHPPHRAMPRGRRRGQRCPLGARARCPVRDPIPLPLWFALDVKAKP